MGIFDTPKWLNATVLLLKKREYVIHQESCLCVS